jgi:hypothetical protein
MHLHREVARLQAVLTHLAASVEQLEAAQLEGNTVIGEYRARLRSAEDVLNRHSQTLTEGADAIVSKVRVAESKIAQIEESLCELEDEIADLDRRKVTRDLPTPGQSELGQVEMKRADAKKAMWGALKTFGAAGGGVAIGTGLSRLWALFKHWFGTGG